MKTVILIGSFLLCSLLVFAGDGPGITSIEVYSIGFTDPDVMQQTVRGLVGPDANVVMDRKGRRLIVSATAEQHGQIRQLIDKLNVPPRNVRIDVRFSGAGSEDRFEAGVGGTGAVIYDGDDLHGRVKVTPRLRSTSTTRSSETVQSLLTMSGREAVLRVGTSVPYLEYISAYGGHGSYVEERVQWQDVGSYLYIQPTVLGDGKTIKVRLTPALSGAAGGGPHRVRYNEMATEVLVQEGQSIRLGGLNEHSDFYSKFLVGVDKGGQSQSLDIVLTPSIVEPGGP